jgi:hypothetical protein
MRGFMFGAVLTAVTLSWSPIAQSQSPPAPQLLEPGPKACPPDVRHPPRASSDRPLGEQLAESKGVICPPANVDPDLIEKPPPTADKPVIRPPGSPGGNPNVVPKP